MLHTSQLLKANQHKSKKFSFFSEVTKINTKGKIARPRSFVISVASSTLSIYIQKQLNKIFLIFLPSQIHSIQLVFLRLRGWPIANRKKNVDAKDCGCANVKSNLFLLLLKKLK